MLFTKFSLNFASAICRRGLLSALVPPPGDNLHDNFKMYAIVEIKGQQFKAEEGKYLYVHHLGDEVKEGDAVSFDKVLLVDADGDVKVGAPAVEGAKVEAEVLVPMLKGDKVIVFKKKRRKGYRRLNGHRQQFSKVLIKKIVTA